MISLDYFGKVVQQILTTIARYGYELLQFPGFSWVNYSILSIKNNFEIAISQSKFARKAMTG